MIKHVAFVLSLTSISVFANSTIDSMNSVPDVKNESKKGFHGQVGLGAINKSEYLGSDDSETIAVPLINVSYNDTFYFKLNRLGAWFYKNNQGFRVGGVITTQGGYDKEDLPKNYQLFDRDSTTLIGVNAQYKRGMFSAEAGFLLGTGDNAKDDEGSEGGKLYVQAGYTFVATSQYTLTGTVKIENWNEDLVEYYCGNKDSAMNVTAGVIGTYNINKKWTLIGAATVTSMGDEITDSPIVVNDSSNMLLIGATYSF